MAYYYLTKRVIGDYQLLLFFVSRLQQLFLLLLLGLKSEKTADVVFTLTGIRPATTLKLHSCLLHLQSCRRTTTESKRRLLNTKLCYLHSKQYVQLMHKTYPLGTLKINLVQKACLFNAQLKITNLSTNLELGCRDPR